MLIHEIVDFCNNEYRCADTEHLCPTCNHPSECSGSCKRCLEQVHFPDNYPHGKHEYDCPNMINYYVCSYSNKYASEMLYLLQKSEKLEELPEYRIFSIGCGAAPDLMAFEQYVNVTSPDKRIRYYGMDMNLLWEPIHEQIEGYVNECNLIEWVEFEYADAMEYINTHDILETNVIVLQYVISYFYNTGQIQEIQHFFECLVENVIDHKKEDEPCVILINDVNSSNRGRNLFTDIIGILQSHQVHGQKQRYYFDYKIKHDGQRYGIRHESVDMLFSFRDVDLSIYDRWSHCSSAQLLIEID